jgi:hypothetical protein
MIVGEDDRGGVVLQGFFQDFARIDGCAVDGAAKEIFTGDELVAFGKVDDAEDFVIESAKPHSEVVCGDSGRSEAGSAADSLGEGALLAASSTSWKDASRMPVGVFSSVV